jgi:hypothetical protein
MHTIPLSKQCTQRWLAINCLYFSINNWWISYIHSHGFLAFNHTDFFPTPRSFTLPPTPSADWGRGSTAGASLRQPPPARRRRRHNIATQVRLEAVNGNRIEPPTQLDNKVFGGPLYNFVGASVLRGEALRRWRCADIHVSGGMERRTRRQRRRRGIHWLGKRGDTGHPSPELLHKLLRRRLSSGQGRDSGAPNTSSAEEMPESSRGVALMPSMTQGKWAAQSAPASRARSASLSCRWKHSTAPFACG